MTSTFIFLLFCGITLPHLGNGQKLPKVKKLNMKVHINATGDTLVMKFLRPNPNTKLEGFVLGYGSNFFSNQYIQWPENGKSYVTEVDAEPRYLVAVKPNESNKKSCKDKSSAKKPLQLVVGTLTPSSVFLSWGILINPQVDWSVLNKCPNDRFYTVRYREKNKDWLFQLCPTTEIVIDNLKPNTMYEFGVKDNTEDGIWSNSYSHKTIPKGKDNGHVQSTYKNHKSIIQMPGDNTKAFIPITVIKQGIQNLSNLIQPKSTAAPPPTEHTPVHKEETKKPFTTTTKPRTPKPKPVFKFTEPPPVAKTEKPDVEYPEAAVTSQPVVESFTPDSSVGTLEWVRATMVTHPYIPLPIVSTEPSYTDEQSRATTSAFPSVAPVPLTRGPSTAPPKTVLANERLHTPSQRAMTVPQIASGVYPGATDVPQISTYVPLKKKTIGILPVPPEVTTDIPLKTQRTTLGVTTTMSTATLGQASTLEDITLKRTTAAASPIPAGRHPLTTDVPQESTHVLVKLHRMTTVANRKLPNYISTTESSLEHPHTTHVAREHYTEDTIIFTEAPESKTESRMFPTDKVQMSTIKPHKTSFGLPLIPEPPSLAPEVTMKMTLATPKQASSTLAPRKSRRPPTKRPPTKRPPTKSPPTKPKTIPTPAAKSPIPGRHPVTTDAPLVSTRVHMQPQRTTKDGSVVPPTPLPAPDQTERKTPVTVGHIHPTQAATRQTIPLQYHTLPPQILTKTTAFSGGQIIATTPQAIAETEGPLSTPAPKERSLFETKPLLSTPVPQYEHGSTEPIPEIIKTDASHTTEQEKIHLASSDKTSAQTYTAAHKPVTETTAAPKERSLLETKPLLSTAVPQYEHGSTEPIPEIIKTDASHTTEQEKIHLAFWTTPQSLEPSTRTTSIRTTLAPKKSRRLPTKTKTTPTPEAKPPTPVLKVTKPVDTVEESSYPLVPDEAQKSSTLAPTTTLATESPFPKLDPKTPHRMPINLVRVHFFEEPETPSVPDNTETAIPSKLRITTDNPLPSDDLKTSHRMPINFIRVHFSEDPEQPLAPINTERVIPPKPRTTSDSPLPTDAPSEKHTTSLPTPKTTQSSKITRTKPVPHTTQIPPQPKTTQRSESPHTKAVSNETQTKKPHQPPPKKQKRPNQTPRPRTKPAPTGTPHVSIRPKIPHHALNATLAPYKVHPRPKTSIRPRTRPAQNGTQEAFRAKPTGDVNWMTDTIPGGRQPDSTKLLGVSRNISMEPNNTSKRTSLVSSPPLLPARPTSSRRRLQPNNVTGRPASSGSVLLARTPSTARPNGPSVSVRTPQKLPTSPSLGEDLVETTVFSPSPKSEVDVLGKTRYTAKHVTYMRKEDLVPCSITDSLRHFPVEEATNQEILNAPQNPPSNLTVVTVEGCSSFVILDWEQPDNDTVTEYEVISKENGAPAGKDKSIITTNQTYSTVENLKPDTSYEFQVIPKNPLGEGPSSNTVEFNTESADPRVSEPVKAGKDAIWTEIKFKPDSYSECKGKQYVKRTWYKKFVGIQLCNSLRYKIYLSDSLSGTFYNIGDQSGYGEDHCQFVDSFLDGRTGQHISPNQLTTRKGFYRSVRQQPVEFGDIGGNTHINYVHWYECGISIPGKW